MSKIKSDIENLAFKQQTTSSNGMYKKTDLIVRAIRKGNENGIQIETPYSDEKEAKQFAKNKIRSWKKKRIYGWKFELIW